MCTSASDLHQELPGSGRGARLRVQAKGQSAGSLWLVKAWGGISADPIWSGAGVGWQTAGGAFGSSTLTGVLLVVVVIGAVASGDSGGGGGGGGCLSAQEILSAWEIL